MGWQAEFYVDERGRSPVEEFLDGLCDTDAARIRNAICLLEEFGLALSAPHVKQLDGKVWELRVPSSGLALRVLYFAHTGQRFVLLHAFVKKSQKTDPRDIRAAERRWRDYIGRGQ